MNQSLDKVLRYLAGNENIEATTLTDLQKLADENPYFPVAQFLLAKKLKSENNTGFLSQAQKTALYFPNPFWLHYQLNGALPDFPLEEDKIAGEVFENNELTSKADLSGNEKLHAIEIESHNKEMASQPEEEMAAITREPGAETEWFLEEVPAAGETLSGDNIKQEISETQIPFMSETTEVLEEMAGVSRETDEATEAFLNEVQISEEENVEFSSQETEPPHAQAEVVPFIADSLKENKEEENGEPDEHERMFRNIKAMLDATTEEARADTENTVIPIDPYYTIDYFASQGIKLELEQNPGDQLGQNLKKFTQWLKHMKKPGPEDAAEVITSTDTEADVQKIAESSNTVREVVTEAMASVLEKQGKKEKAIELYRKLSFLNPDKTVYFAGKIKNLKGN